LDNCPQRCKHASKGRGDEQREIEMFESSTLYKIVQHGVEGTGRVL